MSCAKTAEPIEMQFGTLSRAGPGNRFYMRCRYPHGQGTFGVSSRLKINVKLRIWGWVKG